MKNPKFQVYVGRRRQFYWRLFASNGEIIVSSEGYASKAGCMNGIRSVKNNSTRDQRYQRKTARNGEAYFVLVAGNAKVIGASERYTTTRRHENGIAAVKRIARRAPVEDAS